ncbi:HAL/PAL/TAL family ammonia-lyase [Aliarcobacter cryaerophilus]|uniref:HAL/PAL/TAL family ammonia-lyase n=1 Tax=Aliarcobacter cryaerophilus TaxID=28198 RepID=UPI0021B4304A|nr:aromatic amino acid ammonia-lyase [Aliarcobacter cryaerophilus]MCT7464318.1 aromatic amino acid ammonia-lyase [Aliarcobacter cryaerophilus]MCT7499802.1 aromatic amino acid ammonia-lyase [Aliarcobacter cryaerophilus]MCT7543897.1 aromatic amino acid ammonia-lyase [Aliarcobacter cryaerophilus]
MIIDERYITLSEIINSDKIEISNDKKFIDHINETHNFLINEIKDGKPIYGITTGYGASGKNYVSYEDSKILQTNLFRFHGCGVGKKLSYKVCKYALIARTISLSKAKSGVSIELLKKLEMLIQKDIIPVIPSQGSVGASGDLTPLSYIAAVVAGEREVYYKGEIKDVMEVYKELNITPYTFKPKEALAIMNGTTIMSAIALAAIEEFETILDSMESFVAGMFEVLLGDDTPVADFVHLSKPFSGQIQSAKNIKRKIEGSKLTHGRDDRYDKFFADNDLNIQDNYSMRCAPQVLGVIRDNLEISKNWVEQEINSVNDNPLIDGVNKKIYTSGNFYGGYVAHAMDTLKICAGNLADLLDKEFALLVDHKFNRGLGENLKLSHEPFYHGFKAMQITLSSLSADVMKNTTAASIFSRPTESLNQDKVSMGTTAANDFSKMIPDLYNMLSIAFIGMAQAVDIRGKDLVSPHLTNIYENIRKDVKPLYEDRRMDFDIEKIYTLIEMKKFI